MAKAKPKKVAGKAAVIAAVRKLALSFPDASERPSHGDGEFALWLAAPDGAQKMLIDSEPAQFYRPAYVGHLGWIAVRIDKAPWSTVASVIESAYRTRASTKQIAALDAQNTID